MHIYIYIYIYIYILAWTCAFHAQEFVDQIMSRLCSCVVPGQGPGPGPGPRPGPRTRTRTTTGTRTRTRTGTRTKTTTVAKTRTGIGTRTRTSTRTGPRTSQVRQTGHVRRSSQTGGPLGPPGYPFGGHWEIILAPLGWPPRPSLDSPRTLQESLPELIVGPT